MFIDNTFYLKYNNYCYCYLIRINKIVLLKGVYIIIDIIAITFSKLIQYHANVFQKRT